MDIERENETLKIKMISDVLVDHYASKAPCNWGVIIKFSKDFGRSPLSGIQLIHDRPTDIQPVIKLLRKHRIPILNVQYINLYTHVITLINHSTEN
jgi:hypothetical protein